MSVSNNPFSNIHQNNTSPIPNTTQKNTNYTPSKVNKQIADVIKNVGQNQEKLTFTQDMVDEYGPILKKQKTAITTDELGLSLINPTKKIDAPTKLETTRKTKEVAHRLVHMSEKNLREQIKNPIHAGQIKTIFEEGSQAQEWAEEAKAQGKILFYDLDRKQEVKEFKAGWRAKSSIPSKDDVSSKNLLAVTPKGQIYKLMGFSGAGEFKNTYNTLLIAGPHFQIKSEQQTLVKAVGFTKDTLEKKRNELSQLHSENDINQLKEEINILEKEIEHEKALNNAIWQTKKKSRNDQRIPDPLPHILSSHAVEFKGQSMFLAPLGQGDLSSQKLLSANQKAQLGRDISSALLELQSFRGNETFNCPNGIAHRDIHPGNILIKDDKYMLIDLGKAEKIGVKNTPSLLFDAILPPEYLGPGDTIIDPKNEIYQLGLVLYAVYSDHSLDFKLNDNEKNPLNEMHQYFDKPWRIHRYDHPEEWPGIASIKPPAVKDKILEMLSRDPSKRPTAQEIKTFFESQMS